MTNEPRSYQPYKIYILTSEDQTIKLWSVQTGECLKTMRPSRPYERPKGLAESLGVVKDSPLTQKNT